MSLVTMSNSDKLQAIAKIEGYASIFNEADQSGDSIDPRAFDKFFRGIVIPTTDHRVKMLYQHQVDLPIGCWTNFKADKKGLFVTGYLLLGSPKAYEVYALLNGGAINGLSIGFQTRTAFRRRDGGRHITSADLWEVSIVTFPMATKACITHVGEPELTVDPDPERAGLRTQSTRRAPFVPSGARHSRTN